MVQTERIMYSRIVKEDVNSTLWTCTIVFVVESDPKWSTLPEALNKMVESGKRPVLRNINSSMKFLDETALNASEIENSIPWLMPKGSAEQGTENLDLNELMPDPLDRKAFLIKYHILEMRSKMEKILISTQALRRNGTLDDGSGRSSPRSRAKSTRSKQRKSVEGKRKSTVRRQSQRNSVAKRKSTVKKQSMIEKSISALGKKLAGTSKAGGLEGIDEEQLGIGKIYDEPLLGPHVYFIATGFYDPELVRKLIQLKVPVQGIIALGPDPSTFKVSTADAEKLKGGESETEGRKSIASRQSMKRESGAERKSSAGRKSGAGRKSSAGRTGPRKSVAKKKSIAGVGRKSMGAKKSIAGARKSMARKSEFGGGKSRGSPKKKGRARRDGESYEQFWKKLNLNMLNKEIAEEMKDVAIITLDPEKALEKEKQVAGDSTAGAADAEGIAAEGKGKYEEVVYNNSVAIVYDITKQLRNKAYYSKNITVRNIPTAEAPLSEDQSELKPAIVSKYQSLIELIPMKSVTIEYVLFCMVEHVSSIMDTLSDTSVQEHSRTPRARNTCKPPFVFHRDLVSLDNLQLHIEGIDLPYIHYNIHQRMPYSAQWSLYQRYAEPTQFKCKSHFYKLWRSVDSEEKIPEDLFRAYTNHLVFHKMYNVAQEPPLTEDRDKYEEFVPIVPEISKTDPFSYKNDRFKGDAYKLKSFLECQEILSLFSFPLHSTSVLQYNFIEEMNSNVMLQQLQKCYSDFQNTHCIYFPPTDSMLVWFTNNLNFTELHSQKLKGVLRTPVGFADYYKYVQIEEAKWMASKKDDIEKEDKQITDEYRKQLAQVKRLKGYEPALGKDVQVPLPKDEIKNGDHREVYDLGSFRVESEEETTVFNSIDGVKITVKKCKWVKGGNTEMIITVESFSNTVRMSRIVENQHGECSTDNSSIGIELNTEQGDTVSYRIKKTRSTSLKPEDKEQDKAEGMNESTQVRKRKSSSGSKSKTGRKRSAAGRKSSAGRKSATARKSSAGRKSAAGRKSSAGRKSAVGRRSSAGRKSKVGRKSAVGRKSKAEGRKGMPGNFEEENAAGPSPTIETTDKLFQVTSPTGLKIFFIDKHGEKFVRQEYARDINNTHALDEDHRLFLKDGTVLIYKNDGQIYTLYPNGEYLKIQEVGKVTKIVYKRADGTIETDLETIRRFLEGKDSLGTKSAGTINAGARPSRTKSTAADKRKSVARKSTAGKRQSTGGKRKSTASKRASKAGARKSKIGRKSKTSNKPGTEKEDGPPTESTLNVEELTYYDLNRYHWVDFSGKETHFETGKNKIERPHAHRIRVATDKTGQLYVVRTDGTKMFYKQDGLLHVRYADGTLLTTSADLGEEVNEEVRKPSTSRKRGSRGSLSGNAKSLTKDDAYQIYVMYSNTYDMEHPDYYRIRGSGNLLSVHLPGDVVAVNTADKSYKVFLGNSTAVEIDDREVVIYCRHPHVHQSVKQTLDVPDLTLGPRSSRSPQPGSVKPSHQDVTTFDANSRTTKIEIALPELKFNDKLQLLSAVDSVGRTFRVFSNGSTEFTAAPTTSNVPDMYDHCFSQFNRFFVVQKELNGYEFKNEPENHEAECSASPFDIEPFSWPIHEQNGDAYFKYANKEFKPEMQKKELSRYLQFPRDQWYFSVEKYVDPCTSYDDVNTSMCKPPLTAILWRTRRRLRRRGFDMCATIRRALLKYELYHLRTLKKYLNYLSTYEPGYTDNIHIPFRYRPMIGPLGIENEEEKKKIQMFDSVKDEQRKGIWGLAIR